MIEVTRLNGIPMIVNSDLIKIAEASPDTMLTLIHGEKLVVRESCAEVVEKVLAYRARLLTEVAAGRGEAGALPRVVALASLDGATIDTGSGRPTAFITTGNRTGFQQDSEPTTASGA